MSDSENSSSDSFEKSNFSRESDSQENLSYSVAGGMYTPYTGDPLAKHQRRDNDHGDEGEKDKDGLLPYDLEQRFSGELSVESW